MVMKYKGKTLTAEQESHVNKILDGNDYAIQAPPGSGKTFLLLAMARKMPGLGLSISFNKLLAQEAATKFASTVTCKTGHALAYGSVGFKYRKKLSKLTGKQLADTFDIGDWQLYNSPANKGYLILNTIRKYCYSSDEVMQYKHLPKLTILQDADLDVMREDLIQHANLVFNEMADVTKPMPITHDVYLKIWALTNPIINKDFIFFDEYQDSNPVIAQVIKNQSCQKIFVGDQFQQIYCQPAGTIIAVANRAHWYKSTTDKPIEKIKIGEKIITYDNSHVFKNGRKVTSITEVDYSGRLIVVVTDQMHESKYIPRHQCIIKISTKLKKKHIVYLMKKGNQYRIGKVPYFYESQRNQFGLGLRASVEQADSAWILSVHDTTENAHLFESYYQAMFGIPGTCFREQDKHKIELSFFWELIGDNSIRGQDCLKHFGLFLDMPLWKSGTDSLVGVRRPFITAASNLHDGMMMLPLENTIQHEGKRDYSATDKCWVPIYVREEHYDGKVYSLEVDDHHTYYADGLLTHNSWRGAVNALQDDNLTKLYITRSFRFGEDIANMSNTIISGYYPYGFEYVPFHGNDDVQSSIHYEPLPAVDAILCRTNKGIIAETINALDKGLSVHILGGTQQLTYLINSIIQLKLKGYTNHPDLFLFKNFPDLIEYADSPMGGDIKPILKLIETYGRERLLNILESTVEDPSEADVTITTAHKAKGLEWSKVRLANDFKVPSDNGNPTTEETNILYVAASRALHQLDLSKCEACWPSTFDRARKVAYEQWQVDQMIENEE